MSESSVRRSGFAFEGTRQQQTLCFTQYYLKSFPHVAANGPSKTKMNKIFHNELVCSILNELGTEFCVIFRREQKCVSNCVATPLRNNCMLAAELTRRRL